MNHYVYEITNLINGKKYIGKRSCHCTIEDDRYMGSGKYLKNALNKYGKENFTKNILEICENEKSALLREEYYGCLYDVVNNPMYYNIAECGGGGTKPFASMTCEEYNEMHSKRGEFLRSTGVLKGENNPMYGKSYFDVFTMEQYEEMKRKISNSLKGRFAGENNPMYGVSRCGEEAPMYGKKHTESWKLNHSVAMSGENNPMYGKFGQDNPVSIKVICINTQDIFGSMEEAARWFNLKSSGNIGLCCRGKRKSAGKHPETGESLKWKYLEEC